MSDLEADRQRAMVEYLKELAEDGAQILLGKHQRIRDGFLPGVWREGNRVVIHSRSETHRIDPAIAIHFACKILSAAGLSDKGILSGEFKVAMKELTCASRERRKQEDFDNMAAMSFNPKRGH